MKHFKGFTKFVPVSPLPDDFPMDNINDPNIAEMARRHALAELAKSEVDGGGHVLFEQDENGVCWYDAMLQFEEGTTKVVYDPDTLRVINWGKDAKKLFPHGNNVVELDSIPELNFTDFQFNPVTNKVERNDGLALIRAKRQQTILLRDAVPHYTVLSIMADKTDAEVEEFKAWRDYIIAVKRVDLNQADIEWPDLPK